MADFTASNRDATMVIEEQLPNIMLSQEPIRELPSSSLTQHDVVERRVISLQEEHKSTHCSPSPELVTAFTSEPFLRAS